MRQKVRTQEVGHCPLTLALVPSAAVYFLFATELREKIYMGNALYIGVLVGNIMQV